MAIPGQLYEVLNVIDPLKRPRGFDLEDSIAEHTVGMNFSNRAEAAALHLSLAQEVFARTFASDVLYTRIVIDEAIRVLSEAEAVSATELAFEAHCLLVRTYCFHQVGNKSENLQRARVHLDAARRQRPDLATGLRWAETLLDLGRATQLHLPQDSSWHCLYQETLSCMGENEAPGLRQAALEHTGASIAEGFLPDYVSIEAAEAALAAAGERILTRELALLADQLGERYVDRGWSGDRWRAHHWFCAAERSFYYLNVDPRARARNSLNRANWLIDAEIDCPDDLDYVLNKALVSVKVAAALTPPDCYPDAHAASYLVAAKIYEAAGDDQKAVACLRKGLQIALPGGISWRRLRDRLSAHNESLF